MKNGIKRMLLAAGAVLAVGTTAQADSIDISSVGGLSTEGIGSFTGNFSFQANGFSGGADLSISLTNTSSAANGGYITGFVFNINDNPDGSIVANYVDADGAGAGFDNLTDPVSGSPFGDFEAGSALGGAFLGGGNPTGGIAVGQTRSFLFELSGNTESTAGLSAGTFLSALSVDGNPNVVALVRFRGFEDDGSDKVVPGEVVPLPGAVWGGAALLSGLGAFRAWRRRTAEDLD